ASATRACRTSLAGPPGNTGDASRSSCAGDRANAVGNDPPSTPSRLRSTVRPYSFVRGSASGGWASGPQGSENLGAGQATRSPESLCRRYTPDVGHCGGGSVRAPQLLVLRSASRGPVAYPYICPPLGRRRPGVGVPGVQGAPPDYRLAARGRGQALGAQGASVHGGPRLPHGHFSRRQADFPPARPGRGGRLLDRKSVV